MLRDVARPHIFTVARPAAPWYNKNMKLLVPAAYGLEAVVKKQIFLLGYGDTRARNGRIAVDNCGWKDVARLNVFLRSGERVLWQLGSFPAVTFDQLYEGVAALPWRDVIDKDGKITVVTKTVNSTLFAHHSVQAVGKKAIVSAMGGTLTESGAQFKVELDITDNVVSVNLDTTGAGLHKRGYRILPYSAPIKETLAAALIDLSVYNPDKTFADLFCGSGTLLIEAAIKAQKIAPGRNRTFSFQHWKTADATALAEAFAEADDLRLHKNVDIIGADVNPRALEVARHCAKQAGVEQCIKFNLRSAEKFVSRSSYGVMISNPPYGERLGSQTDVVQTARNMGRLYRTLDKWNFCFITPCENFEQYFGRRADKKRQLYNAGIKCTYYCFNGPKPPKAEDCGTSGK